MTTETVYAVAVPVVVALVIAEILVSAWRNQRYYRLDDTGGTIGLLLGNIAMVGATRGLNLALYFYLYQFRLFDLSEVLPAWALWLTAIVMIDFVFYWFHRMSHRVRFMWAVHMSHHSSEEMNFMVAFRQAWLGPLFKLPFFAVLPLVGLDPTITVVAGTFATFWGVLGHTQIVDKLGPLEWFMNTPSHHRVHHGSNPEYIDKNYGNVFIIWDRLFGTFQREDAPVVYGLVRNVETFNPWRITVMVWLAMAEDLRSARTGNERWRYVFGPPDWRAREEPSGG